MPDRPFVPSRKARTARAESVVADALCRLEALEESQEVRKRARTGEAQRKLGSTVSAVILDAMHCHAFSPGRRISVSLSNDTLKRWRPNKPVAFNAALPRTLERLASLQLLNVEKGKRAAGRPARLSTFAAGPALIAIMQARAIDVGEIADEGPAEPIVLRAPRTHTNAKPKQLDYADTDQTKAWRSEMQAINAWIASADLAFAGLDQAGQLVDVSRRSLRRIFNNGRFDHGGRLYGGFWQDLSKERRLEGLTIDGEPVVELDFGQCGPRILYGLAGKQPPDDCYLVPGYENRRDGFKELLNAARMVGVDGVRRFPKDTRVLFVGSKLTASEAMRLLLQHNAGIRGLLTADIGPQVTFRESEILIDVLLQLKARGIVALPVHDSVVVKQSNAQEAGGVMLEAFRGHTGLEGLVRVEGG